MKRTRQTTSEETGGAGYVYEELVGAWALARLLSGTPLFDDCLGAPSELLFQASRRGFALDDLVATLTPRLGATASISVKLVGSKIATASKGFHPEFAEACWRTLYRHPNRQFQSGVDLCVGIAPSFSIEVWRAFSSLLRAANASPNDVVERYVEKRGGNRAERALVVSLVETQGRADEKGAVGRLLRSVRIRSLPLLEPSSEEPFHSLYPIFTSGDDAILRGELWLALRALAQELRIGGGIATRDSLELSLRERHRGLWERLGLSSPSTIDTAPSPSDPLGLPPRRNDLRAASEILETAYADDSVEIADDEAAIEGAIDGLLPVVEQRWHRFALEDDAEPRWDGSIDLYLAVRKHSSLIDIIVRNLTTTSAVVDGIKVSVLRDEWILASGEMKPLTTVTVEVDDLKIAESRRLDLTNPVEVDGHSAGRIVVEVRSGRALKLRVRVYYNGRFSIARNVAIYDADMYDDLDDASDGSVAE